MQEHDEKLARVARETMVELVGRALEPTPRNFSELFQEIGRERGVPERELAAMCLPAAGAGAVDADLRALLSLVSEVCGALVPLADPDGTQRDVARAALVRLAGAGAIGDALEALNALADLAAARRGSLIAERNERRRVDRRVDELEAVAAMCLEFPPRLLPGVRDLDAAFGRARAQISRSDAGALQVLREELGTLLDRVDRLTAPVRDQKAVVKDLLRQLAEQLALATRGSEAFGNAAEVILKRLESAGEAAELADLHAALVRATADAVGEAAHLREQLSGLSGEVKQSRDHIEVLERELQESKQKMQLDALTGIANRHALDEWVETKLYSDGTLVCRFSLLVIDLDHFKQVNDTWGHLAGDHVLVRATRRMRKGIRDDDLLARYGGEEFVVVLPRCPLQIAGMVAERLRQMMAFKPMVYEERAIQVTASIGVAEARDGEGFRAVFERADQCVYLAKEGGRNRVVGEGALS